MNETSDREQRQAGWALVATGISSIALMAQHPDASDSGAIIRMVHGAVLAVMIVQLGALLILSRDWRRSLAGMSGLLFIIIGAGLGIAAGAINGFAVPAMMADGPGEFGDYVFHFAWEANQAFATLGVIAMGVGIAAWSVRLWRQGHRILAAVGFLCGAAPLGLISGLLTMDIHGALLAYGSQAFWMILFGWTVARR